VSAVVITGQGSVPFATTGVTNRVPIASISNTAPQLVVCSGSHGFHTGDTVEQEGTGGIADGIYQITFVNATSYTLNGTSAHGAGVAAGYAINYQLQPAFQVPSPGDAASVGTQQPIWQGLMNAIPWLYRRSGQWRVHNLYQVFNGTYLGDTSETPGGTSTLPHNPWALPTTLPYYPAPHVITGTQVPFEGMQSVVGNQTVPAVFLGTDYIEYAISGTAWISSVTPSVNHGFIILGLGPGIVQSGVLAMPGYQLFVVPQIGQIVDGPFAGMTLCQFHTTGAFQANALPGLTFPAANLSLCLAGQVGYTGTAVPQCQVQMAGPLTGWVRQMRQN
jgi:hypothetical protein